jgi:hypothetical protein
MNDMYITQVRKFCLPCCYTYVYDRTSRVMHMQHSHSSAPQQLLSSCLQLFSFFFRSSVMRQSAFFSNLVTGHFGVMKERKIICWRINVSRESCEEEPTRRRGCKRLRKGRRPRLCWRKDAGLFRNMMIAVITTFVVIRILFDAAWSTEACKIWNSIFYHIKSQRFRRCHVNLKGGECCAEKRSVCSVLIVDHYEVKHVRFFFMSSREAQDLMCLW